MAFLLIVGSIWIMSLWAGTQFLKSSKTEQKLTAKELAARSLIAGLFFSPGVAVLGYLVFPAPVWVFFIAAILGWPDIFTGVNSHEFWYVVSYVVAPYLLVSCLFCLTFWAINRGRSV
ncbi:hypothetical protein QQM79_20895 [Marinobacteraceae bacterium S3BR75-40.1]